MPRPAVCTRVRAAFTPSHMRTASHLYTQRKRQAPWQRATPGAAGRPEAHMALAQLAQAPPRGGGHAARRHAVAALGAAAVVTRQRLGNARVRRSNCPRPATR